LGKYEILDQIGRGAFATVHRALDTTLDREVALKILHPQLLTDPSFIERFKREARALAKLTYPHIVTVFEIGEAEGRVYIAMELARGPDLGQAIEEQGRFSWNETLALLRPMCEALDHAHGRDVVHRDFKPSNVLLDEEQGALLTDFGFARLMGESSVSLSLSGGILGTPSYIAPEVWELDTARPAADFYALGCIVYEMLIGDVLFAGKTPMQVMRAHDRGPQFPEQWPEGVPQGIDTALGTALARDPAARYPSAIALWNALNDMDVKAQAQRQPEEWGAMVAPTEPSGDRKLPDAGFEDDKRPRRISLWAWALGGLGLMGAVALVVVLAVGTERSPLDGTMWNAEPTSAVVGRPASTATKETEDVLTATEAVQEDASTDANAQELGATPLSLRCCWYCTLPSRNPDVSPDFPVSTVDPNTCETTGDTIQVGARIHVPDQNVSRECGDYLIIEVSYRDRRYWVLANRIGRPTNSDTCEPIGDWRGFFAAPR
jgi:serine/threonine-protein kinase